MKEVQTTKYRSVEITDYTCNGKCSCCGECCGDILHLSKAEIKRIDDYLRKNKIEPTPRSIMVKYDNSCPFRDNENKICKIYEVRPDICRVFICNKTARECWEKRELTNKGKLPRSMRNLFFKDKEAKFISEYLNFPVFDRKGKAIK